MKKILVPTDLSDNSKAGLRFALQWSAVQKIEIVFLHVLHISRPTQWTDPYFLQYSESEKKNTAKRLEEFVAEVYSEMKMEGDTYSCVVVDGYSAELGIMQYCNERGDIDFICMSTRGAGKFTRILGTNTGNLITKSRVPVIAIPGDYQPQPFKQLMFAADFHNYKHELKRVVDFARPLHAPIEVLHFSWPGEAMPDQEIIESGIKKEFDYPVKLHMEHSDAVHSLVHDLQKQIEASKPSMAIMFTDQSRSLFQRIFLSSKSEQLSFDLKVPLLVFNKN
ncbi:MAG TPA: universal stress protein [Chitinophagaceae bacterium]|nr:universal stress protein [Chitinophagaceae bacterium]